MPRLAAFPKAYMVELCKTGSMSLDQWIDLASGLDIDGLELYSGILDLQDRRQWPQFKRRAGDAGLEIPMMCCSPDFCNPDPDYRAREIEHEKVWIEMCAELGGEYCRVLSGQRHPDVSREDGLAIVSDAIHECAAFAEDFGVTLILENHYKDDFWTYPEFAQFADVFLDLVSLINAPNFGVNYDPSNALVAGDDPVELLDSVIERVVTMHASDRHLKSGTLEDLRAEENVEGYVSRLHHGEIGRGLIDYDHIFARLASAGFKGWISIEDGVEGFDTLAV
ncbi:MAG: sugar phosphate isomerase/epimerase family protein, partial [Rhodothermia bacterium]